MIGINLFSLYATLTLDDKQYKKSVENVKKSASEMKSDVMKLSQTYKSQGMSMSDAMKKAYEDIDKSQYETSSTAKTESEKTKKYWTGAAYDISKGWETVKKGLKIAGVAVSGFVTLLAKTGLEYNAQMESYTTDFEVMLGSTAEAAEKVESLKQMAAKTPFELTDLASSTKMLLAFNVANKDTNTVLRQLGDISLGNVQKLDSLSRAYGKMNAAQKVTLEDINIMIDAGYNPLLQIAEKTGESMTELYGRISDGQVAFSEVQEAIAAATSEGGQFYQGMEKASQTTQGLVSTLKDVVNSKAGEFFAIVSEKIKELLPNVISLIENLDVSEVMQKIKEIKDEFVVWLPIMTGITAAIVTFRTAMTISVLIDKATKAMTAFKAAQNAATVAQAALNFVMSLNPFVLIATLIAGVVAALVVLWNTNEGFRDAVINIWNAVKEMFFAAINAIIDWFGDLVNFITGLPDKIKQIFTNIINMALDLGKNIVQNIIDGISSAWNGLVSWFNGIWDGLFGGRTANVTVNTTENRSVRTVDGSHANGLRYVPFDGYIAELHKGERVLTADEARKRDRGGVNVVQNIYSQAKTAADLMREAQVAQRRAVLMGV